MPDPRDERTGRYRRPDEDAVVEALGDPVDRGILALLADKARPVKAIAEALDLSQPTAYRRINRLADDGVVYLERSGITEDGKRVDLYRSAIRTVHVTVTSDGLEVRFRLREDAADRLHRVWMDLKEHDDQETE